MKVCGRRPASLLAKISSFILLTMHPTDGTAAVVSELEDTGVTVELNPSNFGFCGGHNQGARRFSLISTLISY